MENDTVVDTEWPTGLYFHTGNSGYTFQVEDNGQGPELVVSGSVFGHRMLRAQMFTTASGLAALGAFLVEQSKRDFSAPYCLVAEEPTPVMASGPAIAAAAYSKSSSRLGSVAGLTEPGAPADVQSEPLTEFLERSLKGEAVSGDGRVAVAMATARQKARERLAKVGTDFAVFLARMGIGLQPMDRARWLAACSALQSAVDELTDLLEKDRNK